LTRWGRVPKTVGRKRQAPTTKKTEQLRWGVVGRRKPYKCNSLTHNKAEMFLKKKKTGKMVGD